MTPLLRLLALLFLFTGLYGNAALAAETIVVNARGQAAAGGWPTMRVYLNGTQIGGDTSVGDGTVPSTTGAIYSQPTNYSFTVDALPAEPWIVDVAFTDDAGGNGQDRNLWVYSVKIGGRTLRPTDAGSKMYMAAIPPNLANATNIIDGNGGGIYWTATLRMFANPPKLLASYDFEDPVAWNGTAGEVKDRAGASGGPYNGKASGSGGIFPTQPSASPARAGTSGTCAYGNFPGNTTATRHLEVNNLPLSAAANAKTTLAFWMYWNGTSNVLPIGFSAGGGTDLWLFNDRFGFNTYSGDLFGIPSTGLANGWHHVVAVFVNQNMVDRKLYIDGVAQTMTQLQGTPNLDASHSNVGSTLIIGNGQDTINAFDGRLDQVRVYDNELSQSQVSALYSETHSCSGDLIAQYRFEESSAYNGTAGELKDTAAAAGGPFNGKAIGSPLATTTNTAPARSGNNGTCGYAALPGPSANGGGFEMSGLPVSTADGAQTSVAFWMYWDGTTGVMPLGWTTFDLWLNGGFIGFNGGVDNNLYGVSSSSLANGWHHIIAIFNNGDIQKSKMFIDGVEQTLSAQSSPPLARSVSSALRVGGWMDDANYRFSGRIDELKVFNGAVSLAQVAALYSETHTCNFKLLAAYDFEDADPWNGTTGEVKDTAGTTGGPYHGTASGSAGILPSQITTSPARAGMTGTCSYGNFPGARTDRRHLAIANLSLSNAAMEKTTVAFWMYWNGANDVMPIGFAATGLTDLWLVDGQFGFNTYNSDLYGISSAGLANGWHHVVAVFVNQNMSERKLYIDGVAQAMTQRFGTPNLSTGSSNVGSTLLIGNGQDLARGFDGRLDQVRIYDGEPTQAQVDTLYADTHGCGGTLIAQYLFEDGTPYNGTAGELKDTAAYGGGPFNGKAMGTPLPSVDTTLPARAGSNNGTCGYSVMPGPYTGGGAYEISNLPVSTVEGAQTSVAFWMYWDGLQGRMPIGWTTYDVFIAGNSIGFNTGNGNIYGLPATGLANGWHHIIAVFTNGDITRNKFYIDGVEKALSVQFNAYTNKSVGTTMHISGWTNDNNYNFSGRLDDVKVFNGAVSPAQVKALYNETHSCSFKLLAAYDFEEFTTWKGTPGEVKDSAGSAGGPFDGVANGAPKPTPLYTSPARTGINGTCGYASFAGPLAASTLIESPGLPLSTTAGGKTTVSFWMNWDGTSGAMPIGWNVYSLWFFAGSFGFQSWGDIYGTSSAGLANGWHHVIAVFTNGDVASNRLYIDGVEKSLTQRFNVIGNGNAWVTSGGSSLRIGGRGYDNPPVSTNFRFSGLLDQIRVYDGQPTPDKVAALYNETHYCGGELIAQYRFEESTPYNGTAGELKDSAAYTATPYHGKAIGQPLPTTSMTAPARPGSSGTCGYGALGGPNNGGGAFELSGLPVSTVAGAQSSVTFWMYWNGVEATMPIAWGGAYNLFLAWGKIGFNTNSGDMYGTDSAGLANGWHHVTATFTQGDVSRNLLYIDGQAKTLAISTVSPPNNGLAKLSGSLRAGAWFVGNNFRFTGRIDELKVYNGVLLPAQVASIYRETHSCGSGGPIADWRMDETSWAPNGPVEVTSALWRGAEGAVLDSSVNGLHGTAYTLTAGNLPTPTSKGVVCGAGDFTKTKNYVDVGYDIIDGMTGARTVTGWIKTNTYTPYQYMFSNSRDCCGTYNGTNLAIYSSNAAMDIWAGPKYTAQSTKFTAGTWVHLAGTYDGSQVKLYINGVLQTTATGPSSISGPASFRGMIGALGLSPGIYDANALLDEMKIWDRALTASEVLSVATNEKNGLNWDGTTRDCGNLDPVSDWHFDDYYWTGASGEVKDSSLKANHAQAVNGVLTTTAGKICRAGDFQGTSGDNLLDAVIAPIPAGGLSKRALSTSMWVKFDSLNTEQMLLYIRSDGASAGAGGRYFYLSSYGGTGVHSGLHGGVLGTAGSWGRAFTLGANTFSTDRWYHVVVVVDAYRGRITAYLDGQIVYDGTTPAGEIPSTPQDIWIGASPESYQLSDAQIDEVLLFNGALSRDQALSIYANQNASRNWDGSTRLCSTQPGVPGKLNAFETSTAAGAKVGPIWTKLSGLAYPLDVVALDASATTVDTSFEQSVKVEVLATNSLDAAVDANNCLVSGATLLTSKAYAISKGRTTVSLPAEAGAWKNVRLRLSYPAAGTPSATACSNDNFAIRPAAPTLVGSANAPASGTLQSNVPVVKAGSNFTLAATSATAGYSGALSLDTTKMTAQAPEHTVKRGGGDVGTLAHPTLNVNGAAVTATYDEVGYLYLAPGAYRDDDFTVVDRNAGHCITDTATTSYLSESAVNGMLGCSVGNTAELVLGRFIPDHLSLTPLAVTQRSDLSCTSSFTYYNELFTTRFMLTALNQGGGITRNYRNGFARMSPADRNYYGLTASGAPAGVTLSQGGGVSSGSFASGQAEIIMPHKLTVANAPAAPASVSITGKPVDADGVTLSTGEVSLGSADHRQGRARIMNAQGAEPLDLPMTLRVESWGGTASGWRVNSDDNCTPVTVDLAAGMNIAGTATFPASKTCVLDNSGACITTQPSRSLKNPAQAGNFNLWLKAPGNGNDGYVTVTGNVPSYLHFNWTGTTASPSGRATFGIRKSGPVAFRRDVVGR